MPEKPAPPPKLSAVPDASGMFGAFGGTHVPAALAPALKNLGDAYMNALRDDRFFDDLRDLQKSFVGRPTPLFHAKRLSAAAHERARSGECANIWLKREDQCYCGSHAMNNAMGQVLLARKMGRKRVLAATVTGQHGLAAAAAAAHAGLACEVFMRALDAQRQFASVASMKALGAHVVEIHTENPSPLDAKSHAMNAWMEGPEHANIVWGGTAAPHPFPTIVRDFQCVLGTEAKAQSLRLLGKLPEAIVASLSAGGSLASGLFYPFIDDDKINLIGVEAGGRGTNVGEHAAPLCHGKVGVLQGCATYALLDESGNVQPTHSVAAGLCSPVAGPEHAYWKDAKRVRYTTISDAQAVDAFKLVARAEGLLLSLEDAHAIAEALVVASKLKGDQNVVVGVSGRGGKDVDEVAKFA
jgi:tryptophan synthase beta chain